MSRMNRALTSKYATADHFDPLNAAYYNLLKMQLSSLGESTNRFAVLEPVENSQLKVLEARKHNWVVFYSNALAAGADIDSLPDITVCDALDTGSIESSA